MKQGIHPEYHDIKVVMTDGTEFITRSCYGTKDATLNLDIDPKVTAWTGGQQQVILSRRSSVALQLQVRRPVRQEVRRCRDSV